MILKVFHIGGYMKILGQKLKQMMLDHGSFAAMEVHLKKTSEKSKSETSGGGWYTEHYLKTAEHWTKSWSQLSS